MPTPAGEDAGIANPPEGPAAVVPATRRALRAQARGLVTGAVLAAVLLVGAGTGATFVSDANDRLRNEGATTQGVVTDFPLTRPQTVDVRYQVGTRTYTSNVSLGDDVSNYDKDETVTVYYDRSQPSRMTIDGVDNEPLWSVLLFVFGFLGGAFSLLLAAVAGVRQIKARRLLRRHHWSLVQADLIKDERGRIFMRLDRAGHEDELLQLSVVLRRPEYLKALGAEWQSQTLWLAGPEGRSAFVGAPGGDDLVVASRPRTARALARWRKSIS